MNNMNYYSYTILKYKHQHPDANQREIAKNCNLSLGMVNKVLQENKQFSFIQKTRKAIILAAGIGQRLLPLNHIHKAFLEIEDEYLIERLIKQLKEAGIDDISLVLGYQKEKFDYLIDCYGVSVYINRQYRQKSTMHSLSYAVHQIDNSFILPCDIYFKENPFFDYDYQSFYAFQNIETSSAYFGINKKKEIIKQADGYVDCGGFCFIASQDSQCFKEKILKLKDSELYYEEALFDKQKMYVIPKFFNGIVEINTFKDIARLDKHSKNLNHPALNCLRELFSIELDEIESLQLLKEGMTNDSFIFQVKGKRYIMRIPGCGSEQLIVRKQEKEVYDKVKDYGIAEPLVYFNAETGYKVTEFIEGCHNLDPYNLDECRQAMIHLRRFHDLKLRVEQEFNLFNKLEMYQQLNKNPSKYSDYQEVKDAIYQLKTVIENADKNWTLCHIDPVCDNFLVTDHNIYLIDFEYSAMQDSDLDLVMFAAYAFYNKQQLDQLVELYYGYLPSKRQMKKIYAYVAIVGLLWSNWCEYKESLGQEFGEYGYKQYRYAKDFYHIVKEMDN